MGIRKRILAAVVFSLVAVTISGVWWYRGQAKDWNRMAIQSRLLAMSSVEEEFAVEKREIPDRFFLPDEMSFSYRVTNTTDRAYLVETTDKKYLTSHHENPVRVQWAPPHVRLESSLHLPPGASGQITITIDYPDELLEQLDGFLLFDYENQYLINFPRGW